VHYELLLPTPEEDAEALEQVLPGEAPLTYVQRVTLLKLEAAMTRLKTRSLAKAPVICADTTVALGREILGKPDNAQDALRMLKNFQAKPTAYSPPLPLAREPKGCLRCLFPVSHLQTCL